MCVKVEQVGIQSTGPAGANFTKGREEVASGWEFSTAIQIWLESGWHVMKSVVAAGIGEEESLVGINGEGGLERVSGFFK